MRGRPLRRRRHKPGIKRKKRHSRLFLRAVGLPPPSASHRHVVEILPGGRRRKREEEEGCLGSKLRIPLKARAHASRVSSDSLSFITGRCCVFAHGGSGGAPIPAVGRQASFRLFRRSRRLELRRTSFPLLPPESCCHGASVKLSVYTQQCSYSLRGQSSTKNFFTLRLHCRKW